MLPLFECADPAPTKSAAEPLHSVGDSTAVEHLHSTTDPATAEFVVEPLQSVTDSDAAADVSTETSCS
jgi:hypothetical protein